MSKNKDKKYMDKESPRKFSTMNEWRIILEVYSKIKCYVLVR
jgi:hypothetical protein